MPTFNQTINQTSITTPYIELFMLDCTIRGGTIIRFTPSSSLPIVHNGFTYSPLPVQTEGWEVNADGTQPQPRITVSNVLKPLQAAVDSMDGLLNCKLSRIRTFAAFLDGYADEDPDAMFPPDVFYIFQKELHNREVITWRLATPLEAFNQLVPRQQYLKERFPGLSRYRG
jgi:lambda family phage minor tail protein L